MSAYWVDDTTAGATLPIVVLIVHVEPVTGDNVIYVQRTAPAEIPAEALEALKRPPVPFVRSHARTRVTPRASSPTLHRGKRLVAAWRPHA